MDGRPLDARASGLLWFRFVLPRATTGYPPIARVPFVLPRSTTGYPPIARVPFVLPRATTGYPLIARRHI